MKVTKSQLRRIIKEELETLHELDFDDARTALLGPQFAAMVAGSKLYDRFASSDQDAGEALRTQDEINAETAEAIQSLERRITDVALALDDFRFPQSDVD